jgi:putative sugar O-methyltransferase
MIEDNIQLLNILLEEQEKAPIIFTASPYWSENSRRISKEIKRCGLSNFRDNARIAKGYSDVVIGNPLDLVDSGSRTALLHRLVSRLPFVRKKIFGLYDAHIHKANEKIHELEERCAIAEHGPLIDKHRVLLSKINTTEGQPAATMEIGGRETAITYIKHLQYIDIYTRQMDFPRKRSVVEIGGGFGVNAHLMTALYPDIEHFLYIDIPPMLYVATQYLKAVCPGDVYDYRDYMKDRPRALSEIKKKIVCLPPWVLDDLAFEVDLCWNACSFQEMTDEQIKWYAEKLGAGMGADAEYALIVYRADNSPQHSADLRRLFGRNMGWMTVGAIEGKYPHDFYKVIRAEHSAATGDGPVFLLHNKATGIVTYEAWLKDGKQGRADGPAIIERDDATAIVTCEEWWQDGAPHRADGPALIRRDGTTGLVTHEEWWKDGKRIDPPSVH